MSSRSLSLRLPARTVGFLDGYAARDGIPRSELVRRVLHRHLERIGGCL